MFVGHGVLAFAVVAFVADSLDGSRERAMVLGLLAGGFATIPDVDVLHPLFAVLLAPVDPVQAPAMFWDVSTELHRAATHSLVVGTAIAAGVAAWVWRGSDSQWWSTWSGPTAGVGLLGVLCWVVLTVSGPVAAILVGIEVLCALLLATLALRRGVGPLAVLAVAAVGLLSHPFGDLFTGQPPPLLYPFGVEVVAERLSLHGDETLHLLGAFVLELATVWLALAVVARRHGLGLIRIVRPRAILGSGYGAAVFAVPAPTLDAASPFVFSVLAVGLLGTPGRLPRNGSTRWRAIVTAVSAVTVATVAFAVGYVLT